MTSRRIALAVLAVLPLAGCRGPEAGDTGRTTAFHDARLIDGDGRVLAERGTLVVRDGRIVDAGPVDQVGVPDDAVAVDLTGRTVMPGLINAHGHLADTMGLESGERFYTDENLLAQLRLYAGYGVTTVVSLGGDGPAGFRLRDESAAVTLDRARLLVAGPVIAASAPDEARAEVDRVAAMRPDVIKIRVDDNLGTTAKMSLDVAAAVIDQAHQHGLRVAAHVFYLDDAKALVEAGADVIAHSVRDEPVDDELVSLLKANGVCYCPTLTREVSTFVYEAEPDFFSDPFFLRHADAAVLDALRDPARQQQVRESGSAQAYKAGLEVALDNVARLAAARAPLAFGTDTGPPARFQGYFEHLELAWLHRAGLTPAQVLAMATGGTAECLQLEDRGFLRAGRLADFIVLIGNPMDDIDDSRTIESVWIGGRQVGTGEAGPVAR